MKDLNSICIVVIWPVFVCFSLLQSCTSVGHTEYEQNPPRPINGLFTSAMYEDTSETINLSFNFKKPSPTSTDGSYIHTFKNAEGKITTQSGIWVETPSRECLVDALGEHINDIVFQNWMSKDGEISNLHA